MLNRPLVTAVLLATAFPVTAYGQDWRPVPASNSAFDASKIARVSDSVVRVWERYTLVDSALEYARQKGHAEQYRDYAYSMALRQIDCARQTAGFVIIHNYDKSGAQIGPAANVPDRAVDMQPAAPGTNAGDLVKAVCDLVARAPR